MSVAGYSWGQQGYMAWILISLVVCHSTLGEQKAAPVEVIDEETRGVEEYDLSVA